MSEICSKCWNLSVNRYGHLCSLKGIVQPRRTECDRFERECPMCARKCTKIDSGWFCSHCGWTPHGIEGKCSN